MIKFDLQTYVNKFVSEEEIKAYDLEKEAVKNYLKGDQDMMGWCDLNVLSDSRLIGDLNNTADQIRSQCDVFLVVCIGGSYLGSAAVIEALSPYFYNSKMVPEIYFVGTSFSSEYYHDLVTMVKDRNIMVNVISKSGTTLETTVTYNLIMDLMRTKYNADDIRNRVIITTDSENGALREEVNRFNYKSFVMPSNIGGRYSVLSPVGLLPIAVAGIDLTELFNGAREATLTVDDIFRYAVIRDIMYKKGKPVEAYVVYEPKLANIIEWLKQLFGESLGKDGKGILPIGLVNVRDLHSMGQYVQDGTKILFETVINVEQSENEVKTNKDGKTLNEINQIAVKATAMAHQTGEVLSNMITLDKLNAYNIGYLLQFFMLVSAAGGYLAKVNPFDQPGVEEYKSEMRKMLE